MTFNDLVAPANLFVDANTFIITSPPTRSGDRLARSCWSESNFRSFGDSLRPTSWLTSSIGS